jgi:hypothetical protein
MCCTTQERKNPQKPVFKRDEKEILDRTANYTVGYVLQQNRVPAARLRSKQIFPNGQHDSGKIMQTFAAENIQLE